MEDAELLDLAQRNLDRLLEWISRVDNKAAFSFAISTAMAGTLVALASPVENLTTTSVVAGIALVLLLLSMSFVVLLAFPRTRVKHARPDSLFYFASIASQSPRAYHEQVLQLDYATAVEDMLAQCHTNARILDVKFRHLRRSYAYAYASVGPWLIAMILLQSTAA